MDGALRAATEQELLGWLSSSPSALGVDLLEYRTPTTEESVLHLAISREFMTVVHKLVSKNVDVNAQDHQGKTPLMRAIEMRNMDMVHILIDAKSDLSIKCRDGYSALYIAAEDVSRLDIARFILPYVKDDGAHELFEAIVENDAEVLENLLAAGVSSSLRRPDVLQTPAIHSAIHNTMLLSILLEHDRTLVDCKDRQGQTALGIASILGELDAVKLLLQYGANIELKDFRGRTPLHLATFYEQLEVVEYFVEQGASIEARDDDQRTPLHSMAEKGNLRGCTLLCRAKAKLNALDIHGWSPMHLAASLGHSEVCAFFVHEGGLLLEWSDSMLCRPSLTANAWISVSPNKLCMIYSELWDLGVPQTKAKYGTLRIRDLEMNTLMHITASFASTVDAEYLLIALQHHVPLNVQNCMRATPAQSAKAEPTIQFLRAMGSRDFGTASLQNLFVDAFSTCSSMKLLMIIHEITEGYSNLGDPTTMCVSNETGDTVLHVFVDSIKQFSDDTQRSMLSSSQWLNASEATLFLDKMNWAGKTPLHVAAAIGAKGACRALLDHGAKAGLGVGVPDDRLKIATNLATEGWTALNFALEIGYDELILDLMDEPGIFPTESTALSQLKQSMATKRPRLLPLLYQRMSDNSTDVLLLEAKSRAAEFVPKTDPTAWTVFRAVLEAERYGVDALKKYACKDLIIRSTGDTLLHIFAMDAARIPEMTYLLTQEKFFVDTPNLRRKTPLHYACQVHSFAMVSFLLSHGADLRASHRVLRPPPVTSLLDALSLHIDDLTASKSEQSASSTILTKSAAHVRESSVDPMTEQWQTPLHLCLSQRMDELTGEQQQATTAIIELLLQHPHSIMEPSVAAFGPYPSESTQCGWNAYVFERLLADFPQSLPLYLNHFMAASTWYGSTTTSFNEVKEVCRNLDRMTHLTPVMLLPTVHNALKAKWRLYGHRLYRRELFFSVLLVLCFTMSNYTVVTPQDDKDLDTSSANTSSSLLASSYSWFAFATTQDDVVGVFKFLTWALALYHLVYVELWQELRLQTKAYWRSMWNYINLATYLLLLASLPLEYAYVRPAIVESCLSLASILLLFGLMQSLLVYPYFSVLLFTFSRMVRVAIRFCCLHVILLIGFTAAFYLVYHGKEGHETLTHSFATVFFITFGEIQFHDYYSNVASPFRYTFGMVVIVAYIICVNLVGLNMLIAMMTSEYEEIKTQAEVLSTQQLASTMHRYETWLGDKRLDALYESSDVWSFTQVSKKASVIPGAVDSTEISQLKTMVAQLSRDLVATREEGDTQKRENRELAQRIADLEQSMQQHMQTNHKMLQDIVQMMQKSQAS
ncbi:hypothetical protein AeNC1_013167 [Aphanomyces euteiches]|nr:hypothetical protein AeNC1_013167 [Aphanomyces euteiches]